MWVASLCRYSVPHCREVAFIGSVRGILTMRMVFVLASIMWLSRVEIGDYFVLYFDHCITAFESLYCWTSVEGEGWRWGFLYVLCGVIRHSHSCVCPCLPANAFLGVIGLGFGLENKERSRHYLNLWWQTWTLLIYRAYMSPTLNRSSAIWCFERGHVIEIRDGIE